MTTWWRTVIAYPPTWAVGGLVVAAEWGLFSWFRPGLVGTTVQLVLGALTLAGWPIVLSATGAVARLQLARPPEESVDLARLAQDLTALEDPRPARQLKAIQEKRQGLVDVLSHRLDAGEMTYARYLSSVEAVHFSVISNLEEVVVASRSVAAIDDDYVDARLAEIGEGDDAATQRERVSLEDRRRLQDAQERKIADLLAQNEAAMTAIDRTTAALADAPIGRAPQDAEAAMKMLEEMAARAQRYAAG